ncbi:hypothetical protein SKAU_G00259670 [Synaphobranchus kaupii]|uniref:Transmembrane protein 255B n=1 Tax=Synaphobranchus kaupii TaxID=118154 RepID=A0A9Q1F4X0_SYNKA|nr:hypothetical protein SKAU_G00259670 [Synaphobranchus kaupii]
MQQSTVPPTTTVLDPAEQFAKRRKTALWFSIALLFLSVVILVVGLVSATRTGNVAVAGHYPGIILSFGSFLGIVGINLVENRKPMLVASIIFVSIGVIATFFCAIVNGIIAAEFIDKRPLLENRCEFYASGTGYAYDNYYTEVTCYSFNSKCKIRVKSNTCYCCDLHSCESPDDHSHYYEYTGVNSCSDVVHLYRLLWSSVVLNILGLFLGILTAAILGAFKDINPAPQTSPSMAPPPHILYNPTQHMLTYAGFCPSTQALPTYPNYPLPIQHHGSYQPPPAAPPAPEAPASPSEESQAPSQASSSYMLTPNAPVLYGMSYGPFEKPPPYAC